MILHIEFDTVIASYELSTIVIIHNTTFSMIRSTAAVVLVKDTSIKLQGPITFIQVVSNTIIMLVNSRVVHLNNYIQFSYSQMFYGIIARYIILEVNATLDIIANNFSVFFLALKEATILQQLGVSIHYCTLQYVETHQHTMRSEQYLSTRYQRYSVIVKDNIGNHLFNGLFAASHCEWIDHSVYKHSDPYEINKNVIQYSNNSFKFRKNNQTIILLLHR